MDGNIIINGIVALATALLTFGASRLTQKKQENLADFQELMNRWETDNDRLRHDLKAITTERDHLLLEKYETSLETQGLLSKLRSQLQMLESGHWNCPLPWWLKAPDGTMLALNEAYEEMFLKPMGKKTDDYIGNQDADMFGAEIAQVFRKHDLFVFNSRKTWSGFEMDGQGNKIYVIKYVRFAHGMAIGIGGIVIPRVVLDVPGMLDFLKAA